MGKRIFVDMDGTLAEFRTAANPSDLYQKGFFLGLNPLTNVIEAVKILCKENHEVYILSSVLKDSKFALDEKNRWLDAYLPEIPTERRLFPACGTSKKSVLQEISIHDVLLDDFSRNLHDWNPGHAIKLINGINGTKGTWKGDRVYSSMRPDIIARDILAHKTKIRD